jgi:ribosomal protein S20
MPVTKTAKRALRGSLRKAEVNKRLVNDLDAAIRTAKRDKSDKTLQAVFSLADRAAKAHIIHTKKADRIKSRITKKVASA